MTLDFPSTDRIVPSSFRGSLGYVKAEKTTRRIFWMSVFGLGPAGPDVFPWIKFFIETGDLILGEFNLSLFSSSSTRDLWVDVVSRCDFHLSRLLKLSLALKLFLFLTSESEVTLTGVSSSFFGFSVVSSTWLFLDDSVSFLAMFFSWRNRFLAWRSNFEDSKWDLVRKIIIRTSFQEKFFNFPDDLWRFRQQSFP